MNIFHLFFNLLRANITSSFLHVLFNILYPSFLRSAEEGRKDGYKNIRSAGGYWRQWADERFGIAECPLPPVPQGGSSLQEPSVVRDKDGRPQEDPLAVHCFCVCSESVLLGDLLGVSRSRERDLLYVLFIMRPSSLGGGRILRRTLSVRPSRYRTFGTH